VAAYKVRKILHRWQFVAGGEYESMIVQHDVIFKKETVQTE
jgi:hypothetical protein